MTRMIGLTGGIACGKSLVASFLRELGVPVFDADQAAREVVTPGSPALDRIVAIFGGAMLRADGTLDRPRLGQLVFGDPVARSQLEAIMHPAIAQRAAAELARQRELGTPALLYEAALLVETGLYQHQDALILVVTSPAEQLRRLLEERGLGRAEAEQRLAAQWPTEAKRRVADAIIDNSGTPAETRAATGLLWRRLNESLTRGRTPSGRLVL